MKIFNRFCALFLAVIIFTTNLAQAGTIQADQWQRVEKIVSVFNRLTPQDKMQLLAAVIRQRTDLTAIEKEQKIKLLASTEAPTLKANKGSVGLTWKEHQVTITPVKGSVVKINGVEVDLGQGKFNQSLQEVEKVLTKKSVSLIDLFIAPAYADAEDEKKFYGVLLGLMVLGVAAIIFPVTTMIGTLIGVPIAFGAAFLAKIFKESSPEEAQEFCREMRKQVRSMDQSSPDEIRNLQQEILEVKTELKGSEDCLEDAKQSSACSKAEDCLLSVESELSQLLTGTVNSSRQSGKDSPDSKTGTKSRSNATDQ